VAHTGQKAGTHVQKFFVNGHDLTWADSTEADYPDDDKVLAGSWVLSVYPDYLRQRYPDLKPEEDGTTREKQYARTYQASRLLHEITGFTLTVNKTEEEQLAKEFAAYG
jgi:hypothetical protein